MSETLSSFRIEIDGSWTARDMYREIEAITFFHDAFYLVGKLYEVNNLRNSKELSEDELYAADKKYLDIVEALAQPQIPVRLVGEFAGSDSELKVRRIEYGSPGFQDFLGVGKIVRELLRFIRDMFQIKHEIEKQKLDNEKRQEQIRKMKIKNLGSILKILKDNGVGVEQRRAILENMIEQQAYLGAGG
jgi:hypothetical protein